MNRQEYTQLTAASIADLVRRLEISPVEITRAALDAVAATEPAVNAWAELLGDQALSHARVLEAEANAGSFRGPLHGVPVGVKDLFLTAGVPTRRGCRLYAESVPNETSPAVERIVKAGAIMLGKTTTADSGWKASSNSPQSGVTRNPWDPARTAGGSSCGSAAAVAAGNVPITLGSDGGGSLRIPASFCGIFSMKPTLGLVPTYPLSTSEHLSHAGPMTSSVLDYALALDALKGPHLLDPYSLPDDGRSYVDIVCTPARSLRCVLAPSLFGREVDADVARVVTTAFARVQGMAGITIEEREIVWPDPISIFERLWTARGAPKIGSSPAELDLLDPGLARLIRRSASISLADHLQALQDRAVFCREANATLGEFDILLTPMVPIKPFMAEDDGPKEMDMERAVPWAHWTPFSYPFNITGQPAASVPCGWTSDGLPVGLQVIGARFADDVVIQFCAQWEKHFNWHARRPAVHSGK